MVFHQAAILIDPDNYVAANELGVLLARYGQFQEARELLLQSLVVWPMPETWQNLATVYDRLGATEQARQQQAHLAAGNMNPATLPVDWISPQSFAGSSSPSDQIIPHPAHTAETDAHQVGARVANTHHSAEVPAPRRFPRLRKLQQDFTRKR